MSRFQTARSNRGEARSRLTLVPNVSRSSRRIAPPTNASAARAFYVLTLLGRPVRHDPHRTRERTMKFMVGQTVVDARPDLGHRAPPVVLEVTDAERLAERCWDAGFTVRIRQDGTDRAIVSVIDPFGRRLDLVPAARTSSRGVAGEEEA